MAGKFSDRRNGKGTSLSLSTGSMRNWEDGQNAGAHPSRILQPEPQNHCKLGFYPFTSANAFLGPAFNACLDAHADVDPALLRYSRAPGPTRTLIGQRPSPIIIPATHEQSAHLPLHRCFPATSPISTGSNLSCRALPTPVKRTINGKMQEEDVVVMEGVLVTSLASTGTWPRSSPAAAGSSLSPTSLSSTSVLYKTEMCRSWEEMGACRYGARCQFAHGKQELRQVLSKNKPEVSRPRVSAQGLSTLQEVEQNEEEKKIMPQSEEFEAMVDALINPNADVAFNKRRLPVFVALTDP